MPEVRQVLTVNLAAQYSRFRVSERLLLTGHSHQAWPDVAFEAQQHAWLDAAAHVDDKWERAAAVADDVRAGWRRLLNDRDGDIALAGNTHELIVRLLSAVLPMFALMPARQTNVADAATTLLRPMTRTRLLSTDGEFHTIRRQLDRLAEEGVEVTRVAARPVETLAARMAAVVDHRVACVLVSSVLFETAEIVPHLHLLAEACRRRETPLLVDAYHHLNVVPFDVNALGLADAFIVGGGYKYCQLGEGNCFLRLPPDCRLRPVITGWFSEFAELSSRGQPGDVQYGRGPARFAGATYDPTSHYRAAAVFAFHRTMTLTPERLREISQHQVTLLRDTFNARGVNPVKAVVEEMPDDRRGGFLAIRSPHAGILVPRLRQRGLFADARGAFLRLGPAPYVSDAQLAEAVDIVVDELASV